VASAGRPRGAWGRQLKDLRKARGLTQVQLAQGAGVSRTHLAELETGRSDRPNRQTVERLATALEAPELLADWSKLGQRPGAAAASVTAAIDGARPRAQDTAEHVDLARRPRRLLIEWGTCGVPLPADDGRLVASEGDETVALPDEFDEEALRLIGGAGYAVRVRGQSMVNWRMRDGDIVWVNPEKGRSFGMNRPVLAQLLDAEGNDLGMVVKVLRQEVVHGDDGSEVVREYLQSDGDEGDNDIRYYHFKFYAPCVWRQPRGETLVRDVPSGQSGGLDRAAGLPLRGADVSVKAGS
jgi:transcriptional regulator with XRE-family HTH domain